MTRVYPHYDYDLAEELVLGLQSACGVEGVLQKLTEKLSEDNIADHLSAVEAILENEGRLAAEKSLEFGQKFKDRTAELMEEVAVKTGIAFPSIPQRYFEIAITCPRPKDKWLINAANTKEFTYSIKSCSISNGVKKIIPSEKNQMPCVKYCTSMSRRIFDGLGIKVKTNLLANMDKDGYCRFQFLMDKGEGDGNEL